MANPKLTKGSYIGKMPEDIYIVLGDKWNDPSGTLVVTQKKYITSPNEDYDIEVLVGQAGTAGVKKTVPASSNNAFDPLPAPPKLAPHTAEYLLTMKTGDQHLAPNMYVRTVTSKTFTQDSNGQISITVTYDK